MPDNTILNPGVGGDTIATDDIGGVKHELVKVEFGSDGTATQVDAANPLPVTDAASAAALAAIAAEDFATHDAQIDGSQKTQIVDASGNIIGSTGNGLDVNIKSGNVTLVAEDIEIGAVELKDSATNDRASIINTAPTTEFGLVTRNIPSGTQPVSAASLPLPAGAATAANQATQITAEEAIQAAVQIMDDWDESDRAKTNPIVGQAGVQGGAGAVSANTQRVVIATDQTPIAVTGTFGGTDNTQLYSGTLSVTGAITGIDTTGYIASVIQLSGVWTGSIVVEGSNDNLLWQTLIFTNPSEITQDDTINSNGIYVVKSTTKYIRLNVTQLSIGSITALILGRTQISINAADRISLAMDKGNNTPLYVSESDSKKDQYNALIPSDAPKPIYGSASILNGVPLYIDTTGYQSIVVQVYGTWSGTLTFQNSIDGVIWASLSGFTTTGTASAFNTTTTNNLASFAAIGRYFRILVSAYTSGTIQAMAYLRQQPIANAVVGQNLQFINGTAPVSPNAAGVLSVGGFSGAGGTTGIHPILIGGTDSTNTTTGILRRLLTDTSGRLIGSVIDQTQSSVGNPLGGLSKAASLQNVASVAVQDTSQFEGKSFIELLGQILLELRINNQLLSELPIALQSQDGKLDEPAFFRNEQSIFADN